jgi:hypothetical protein
MMYMTTYNEFAATTDQGAVAYSNLHPCVPPDRLAESPAEATAAGLQPDTVPRKQLLSD